MSELIRGDDDRVMHTFGLVLSRKYAEAVAAVDALLAEPLDRRDQNTLRMFNNYLIALIHTEQYDKGARFADEIQDVAPGNPDIYHNAACLCCFTGELDRALEQVKLARQHGGMKLIQLLMTDEDLEPIMDHPVFEAIVLGKEVPLDEDKEDGKDSAPPSDGDLGPIPY